MKIRRVTLGNCHEVDGVVVVIDVLRAFTTAAFAFDRGADEILLVSTVEEAFELRNQNSDCLLMGEVEGLPIKGFDLPNSPTAVAGMDLSSRRLIQRTTAGTQGVVLATKADHLFAASLCVGAHTAMYIETLSPKIVTFVETGVRTKGGGDEDVACSDYIAGCLLGTPPKFADIRNKVLNSSAACKFTGTDNSDFPRADVEHALMIDRFDFAMEVKRRNDLLVLKSVNPRVA
jgi:2-phosphosulfolactate phosphatase